MQTSSSPSISVLAQATVGGQGSATPQATTVTVPTPVSTPLTHRDIQALRERRSELSNQLQSAEGRRNRLAEAMERAEGADKAGLEQRVTLLDQRILQLEADIAETGRVLTSAPAGLLATTETARDFGPLSSGQMTAVSIVFTLFVLFPIAFAMARLLWKRGTVGKAALPPEAAERLERIEQAVDAVAIEVERISEGQRYVTRVLGTGQGGALGSQRQAEAAYVPVNPIGTPRQK